MCFCVEGAQPKSRSCEVPAVYMVISQLLHGPGILLIRNALLRLDNNSELWGHNSVQAFLRIIRRGPYHSVRLLC